MKMPRQYGFSNELPALSHHKPLTNETPVKRKAPVRDKTDNQGLASPGKYRHACSLCEKGFSDKRHLQDHYRTRHNAAKLKCDYCENTFNTLRGLERHQPVHTVNFPHQCNTCNKGFNFRAQLQAHENQHLGEDIHVSTVTDCSI